MKLVKWILNLILLAVSFCVISAMTFVTYNIVAIQTTDTSARINIANEYSADATDEENNKKSVWYFDNYAYWGDDIKINTSIDGIPDPITKYRVSNWFSWSWWKTAGSYIDVGVNDIVAVVKPIILPAACADELMNYYDTFWVSGGTAEQAIAATGVEGADNLGRRDIEYFCEKLGFWEESPTKSAQEQLRDFSSVSDKYFDVTMVGAVLTRDETIKAVAEGKYDLRNLTDTYLEGDSTAKIFRLADDYNSFYQYFFKLYKYNINGGETYHKWFVKFIIVDSNGSRSMKSSVIGLFFLQYIDIILAFAFVWLNPISVERDENTGAVQAKNSVFRRLRWKHRHRKHMHDDEEPPKPKA